MASIPVAYKSACWVPLNDPQGQHHFQRLGDYLITRVESSTRPTTYIVSRLDNSETVMKTEDYTRVMDLILN